MARIWIASTILSISTWAEAGPNFITSISNCVGQDSAEKNTANLSRKLDSHTLPESKPNAKIAAIELKQLNVFDTQKAEENNALFRFANRAHITTKPEVIEHILLFEKGNLYDRKKLIESERLLRAQSYLYDAFISAEPNCDGDMVVTVTTRDLWTLLPDISFSRSGGENSSRLGFRESNLFGYGKRLSLTRTKEVDRTGYLFVYDDPNILSSRYDGRLEYSDNDDGKAHYLDINYPFFSISTPYSYGVLTAYNQREESLYFRGNELSEFQQTTRFSQLYVGSSTPLSDDWRRRILFGFIDHSEKFSTIPKTTLPIAKNRALVYPYIELQWLEDSFVKVRNFDSISRTEDLNLGWQFKTRVGYSTQELSNDDQRLIANIQIAKTTYLSENSLLRTQFELDGYWNKQTSRSENLLYSLNTQYYLNTSYRDSWYANLSINLLDSPTPDKQLTLGGETGLRGYPIKYLQGKKQLLLNIERRYYWEYDLFHLFQVGGAAFFDYGHMSDSINAHNTTQNLTNLGFGFRLAPSRANSDVMLHLDVAFPMNAPDDVDKVQWLFTVKNRF